MIFLKQRLLFIHTPKTAGNFFSRSFLKYSGDEMFVSGSQDGHDRFNVKSDVTLRKHQTLQEYHTHLGDELGEYTVYSIARPPLDRLISLYYSPHQWLKKSWFSKKVSIPEITEPVDIAKFSEMVRKSKSLSNFLDSENLQSALSINKPAKHVSGATIKLLRFDNLRLEMETFARENGFGSEDFPVERVNVSASTNKDELILQHREELDRIVKASHHDLDNEIFE